MRLVHNRIRPGHKILLVRQYTVEATLSSSGSWCYPEEVWSKLWQPPRLNGCDIARVQTCRLHKLIKHNARRLAAAEHRRWVYHHQLIRCHKPVVACMCGWEGLAVAGDVLAYEHCSGRHPTWVSSNL